LASYVVATAAAAIFLGVWHGFVSSRYRKPAQVRYPDCFASAESIAAAAPDLKQKKYLFNCAQRAHANYLENLPGVLTALMVGGALYPKTSAGLGAAWVVSRIAYTLGYLRADKTEGKGRSAGTSFFLFQLGLLGVMGKTAFDLITA
jgi:glutathione S-transferase